MTGVQTCALPICFPVTIYGSGGAATAAESAQMMPADYSFIGDAANRGLVAYNTTRSVDASVSLQKSQENVNKSIEGVNMAQKGFMESQTDMQKMTYKFAMDTYQNRLLQEQFKAELANWQGFDAMYDARLKAFSLPVMCAPEFIGVHGSIPVRLGNDGAVALLQ